MAEGKYLEKNDLKAPGLIWVVKKNLKILRKHG